MLSDPSVNEQILERLVSIDNNLRGVPTRLTTRNRLWLGAVTVLVVGVLLFVVRGDSHDRDVRSNGRCSIRAAFVADHARTVKTIRSFGAEAEPLADRLAAGYAETDSTLAENLPADCEAPS